MVLSLEYAIDNCWTEVCKKVQDAIVFIDEGTAECLHWNGGLVRLVKSGALGVKDFSCSESGSRQQKKAVFLLTTLVDGPLRLILKEIILKSFFEHCIVITACSPTTLTLTMSDHPPEGLLESPTLDELEKEILHWMKCEDNTVELFHFPYGVVSVTEYFFVTPMFTDLFPLFHEPFESDSLLRVEKQVMKSLLVEQQVASKYLNATLNALLSGLNVREDIYCLGPFSTLIGSMLQNHSTSILRSKTANSTMSLLLIDRSLDVCSCSAVENYSFLDCMKSVLPPFPGHHIDIAVSMSSLFSADVHHDFNIVPPGCLHEPRSPMFEWLISKQPQDILKALAKEIFTICNKREKENTSPSELEEIIKTKFSENYDFFKNPLNASILQYTFALTQTTKSSALEKMKLTGSFQKLLMQSIATDNKIDDAVCLIIDIICTRRSKGFEINHIILILIFFYSFIGDKYEINPTQESVLSSAFMTALVEDKERFSKDKSSFLKNITHCDVFCSHVFSKLKSLKMSRNNMKIYRSVAFFEDAMMPLEYKSVLKQLLEDITDPSKPEITDLKHKPNLGLRDNFASRFSSILSTARPHILDSEGILVFIIGGITGMEVKLIKDYLTPLKKTVIIGSTALTCPSQLIKNLFF